MYSSVYGICHRKKLLMRISPLVRINRSGSGMGPVSVLAAIIDSSISASLQRPAFTFRAMSRTVLTMSRRPL